MKLLFVVNPISGGVNKEPYLKNAKSLCKKYGVDYEVFKTTGSDDDHLLKRTLSNYNPDKVASVGGDGTTLFTATALLGSDYPIGIIPMGSANGMAAELFVNPDPVEALKDIIMSNVFGGLDMVVVNDKYYTMHIGDVGANANIVDAFSKDDNRGMATYAKYFIEEIQNLEPFGVTIHANGKTYSEKSLMVGICNARKYGTGVPINIVGNPMDGKFEIVIIREINLNLLVKAGLSRFNEKFHDSRSGDVIVTDKAEIEFDRPRLLQLDGEIIGKFNNLSLRVLKGAVKLITHRENTYIVH